MAVISKHGLHSAHACVRRGRRVSVVLEADRTENGIVGLRGLGLPWGYGDLKRKA